MTIYPHKDLPRTVHAQVHTPDFKQA